MEAFGAAIDGHAGRRAPVGPHELSARTRVGPRAGDCDCPHRSCAWRGDRMEQARTRVGALGGVGGVWKNGRRDWSSWGGRAGARGTPGLAEKKRWFWLGGFA